MIQLKLHGNDVDAHQLLMEAESHQHEEVEEFVNKAKEDESMSRAIQRVFDKTESENPFNEILLADLTLELEAIEEENCEL